jgi:hypothetical protein
MADLELGQVYGQQELDARAKKEESFLSQFEYVMVFKNVEEPEGSKIYVQSGTCKHIVDKMLSVGLCLFM